ncbi:MAG: hypothetical protein ACFB11_13745 [Paracoccaceae bacterium]
MIKALALPLMALALVLLPRAAVAEEPALCDPANPYMEDLCKVIQSKCMPYLQDPTSLSPDDLGPVPKTFRRYFESALNTHVIGYQKTEMTSAMVVYLYDEPACEVLAWGLGYADLLRVYDNWRDGPGARFTANNEFEPKSKVTMARAYAATFLAAPMRDGRVTEVTLNWNMTFEGLTRFRVSYQPLRDHTANLMGVSVK